MSNNRNITPMESLEAVYKFGTKQYKRGYYRAALEVYAGIGICALAYGVPALWNWIKDKRNKNTEE